MQILMQISDAYPITHMHGQAPSSCNF